jgi:guanylate kinase
MEKKLPKPSCGRASILVISAPSGSGKSTLVRRLIASLPDLAFSVSHTTRPRREGEKEGRDYFFVTRRRFERMIAAGDFIEWAEVFGHLYGTSKAQIDKVLAAGRDVLLDIDVQGHQQVRKRMPEALSVFVMPPSFRELKRRLTERHSDSPQAVERRLAAARQEIAHWPDYDYLVVNDRLSLATQALRAIVRAARFRRQSQAERAQGICRTFGGKIGWNCLRS